VGRINEIINLKYKMKTTDETIKAVIGIRTDADKLTPMDKGECKLCMKAYAKEFKPIFDKMLTWVEDDFNKGLFIEQFEQFLRGEQKQNGA
jgi:hypothetical protein